MLEGRFTRFRRETLRTGPQREMGTADLTEQIRQIVKRSMIANGFPSGTIDSCSICGQFRPNEHRRQFRIEVA